MIPTGIVFITSDKVNIQPTIVIAVSILGISIVNPWAPLAKPFEAVPRTTATKRIIYAVVLPIIFYASPSPRCPQKKPNPKFDVVKVTAVPFGK